jgi:hypothetical protein
MAGIDARPSDSSSTTASESSGGHGSGTGAASARSSEATTIRRSVRAEAMASRTKATAS